MTGIREQLTPEQRATDLDLVIDPGFASRSGFTVKYCLAYTLAAAQVGR
jgi:hypothetical protein